jgi:hypothetical protein
MLTLEILIQSWSGIEYHDAIGSVTGGLMAGRGRGMV